MLAQAERPIIVPAAAREHQRRRSDLLTELAERRHPGVVPTLRAGARCPTNHRLMAGWPDCRPRQPVKANATVLRLEFCSASEKVATVTTADWQELHRGAVRCLHVDIERPNRRASRMTRDRSEAGAARGCSSRGWRAAIAEPGGSPDRTAWGRGVPPGMRDNAAGAPHFDKRCRSRRRRVYEEIETAAFGRRPGTSARSACRRSRRRSSCTSTAVGTGSTRARRVPWVDHPVALRRLRRGPGHAGGGASPVDYDSSS